MMKAAWSMCGWAQSSAPSDRANPAVGGAPVQALARGPVEDRSLRPLTHGQVDHPGGSGHEGITAGLEPLAHDPKGPVETL